MISSDDGAADFGVYAMQCVVVTMGGSVLSEAIIAFPGIGFLAPELCANFYAKACRVENGAGRSSNLTH